MNTQITQAPPEMTPDEAAASLAFATRLSEQQMPKAPQTPETAPESTKAPETEKVPTKEKETSVDENKGREEVAKTMDSFKDEMRGMLKKEFDDLKKELKNDQETNRHAN